ncbi:MAG: hypothetical protein AAB133_08395, partial [Pseudomonadota bacterium]
MKVVPANIPRTVVTRGALAWAVLSLLAGAAVLYLELGRVDRMVHELAATETRRFTEHIEAIGPEHVAMLEEHAREFLKGDFVSVRLYAADRKRILEAVDSVC